MQRGKRAVPAGRRAENGSSRGAGRGAVGARRLLVGAAVAGLVGPAGLLAGAGTAQAAAPSQGRTTHAVAPPCTADRGPYQRQVEKYLKLDVDGRQSTADCRAIAAFQTRHHIRPNAGYPGPITWATIQRLRAEKNPNKAGHCPESKGRIVCIDLTRQLLWVQDGSTVRYGPKPIRTGRDGYETRTGLFHVYWRHLHHFSTLYHVPMPYSQFFSGGQAIHAVSIPTSAPPGSHGCVNMSKGAARQLWKVTRHGDPVAVWGSKPGT